MGQSKRLQIFVLALLALLLLVGPGGNPAPAIAGPDMAPLQMGSGGVFSIAGTSFTQMYSSTDYDYESWGGISVASGTPWLAASVELPDGATINSVTFYWNDGSFTETVHLHLYRYKMDGTFDYMGTASSSGSVPGPNSTNMAFSYPVIDNVNYSYVLYLQWSDAVGDTLIAYGAKINYSTTSITSTAQEENPLPPGIEEPTLPTEPFTPAGTEPVQSGPDEPEIIEEGPVLNTGGETVQITSALPAQDSGAAGSIGTMAEEDKHYAVSADAFHPSYADTTHLIYSSGGRYVTGGQESLTIPVDLPDGAKMTLIEVWYYDNTTERPTWNLYEVDRQGDGSFLWSYSPNVQGTSDWRSSSIGFEHTVDNQNYAYYFRAHLDSTAGASLRIKQVEITYSSGHSVYLPLIVKN